MQGGNGGEIEALSRGDLASAGLDQPEQVLLQWVELLTIDPQRNTAADVERVRAAGWSDAQIAEAVYITGLFALFNRVADAFGLDNWSP